MASLAVASAPVQNWITGLPQRLRTTVEHLEPREAAATILREWTRSVQNDASQWIERLVESCSSIDPEKALDWVDPVSGCSPIHFAVKSGCDGLGDDASAAVAVSDLIRKGADTNKLCAYAHMTPLHYAAHYGCPAVIGVLLRSGSSTGQVDINKLCDTKRNSTALHLAVMGGHVSCVQALVDASADIELPNANGKRPIDIATEILSAPAEFDDVEAEKEIVKILERASSQFTAFQQQKRAHPEPPPPLTTSTPSLLTLPRRFTDAFTDDVSDTSSIMDSAADDDTINVGDRVLVHNKGPGIVRFKDKTKFKPGLWYGVQLDKPVGKNNGTVGNVTYFRTKPNHGVFVRRPRLKKLDGSHESGSNSPSTPSAHRHSKLGRRPAPFTAPTFRTKSSLRPDSGNAAQRDQYSFSQKGSPTSSLHGSAPGSPRLLRHSSKRTQSTKAKGTESPFVTPRMTASARHARVQSLRSEMPLQKNKGPVSPAPFGPVLEPFGIHSRVLYNGAIGTVAYVGPSHLGSNAYIGVIFSQADEGRHSGTVDGHFYFKCPPGRGILAPANQVHWHGRRVDKVLREEEFNLASPKDVRTAERRK